MVPFLGRGYTEEIEAAKEKNVVALRISRQTHNKYKTNKIVGIKKLLLCL